MASLNPAKFIREVRQEMDKITWPTRKEAGISTLMVIMMAAIAAVFFVFVDMVVGALVRWIIGV